MSWWILCSYKYSYGILLGMDLINFCERKGRSNVPPCIFSDMLYYFCSILSAEFIRASIHDATERDVVILSKAKARASLPMNGIDDEVRLLAFILYEILSRKSYECLPYIFSGMLFLTRVIFVVYWQHMVRRAVLSCQWATELGPVMAPCPDKVLVRETTVLHEKKKCLLICEIMWNN